MRRGRKGRAAAGEGEGDASPSGAPGRALRRGKEKPRAPDSAGSNSTGGESLRDELRRWGLCRTFVHQFRLIARRAEPKATPATKTKGRGGGGTWRPYRVAPKRVPGLAAVKHAQQQNKLPAAARAAPAVAVDYAWPEDMRRELHACRTPADHRAWSEKWAEHLSGRAALRKIADAMAQRPAAWPPPAREVRRLAV
jgi:hypothetical protein